jgi:hypothetical protein
MIDLRHILERGRRPLAGVPVADLLSVLCLATISCVMLFTLSDYGLTYDEEPHIRYGERVLAFYTQGFRSSPALIRSSYGAGFDLLAALLRRVSPWDEFRTNHLLCVFVAQLGLLGTWKLGRLAAGPSGGLFSLLFLVLTPVYYGHQFNNPKDIPFAAGYVWGLYFIARLLRAEARAQGLRFWIGLAVALALGMSVRVGGAILVAYLLLFLALRVLDTWRTRGLSASIALRSLVLRALLAALAGWALMVVFWPRALLSPVEGPRAALETVSDYIAYDSPTLLAGQKISSNEVPWDYLPRYFALQLPELTSLCLLLTLAVLCVQAMVQLWRRSPLPWVWWLLVVAVLLPPAYAIHKQSTLYNGLRHFLFVIPPLSVLAGAGVAVLMRELGRRKRVWAAGVVALLLTSFVADQVHALWRLHPYQHVFFNRASGGLAATVGRYETEYYGSVYQELNARLVEQVWTERRDEYLNRIYRVSGCGSNLFFTRNLPLNFEFQAMRRASRSDFFASYVRDGCLAGFRDRRLVLSVQRDGATLAVVRDLKKRKVAAPRAASRGR